MNTKDKILDISVNLARVSDWILDENKQKRIDQFLGETEEILKSIDKTKIRPDFSSTFSSFQKQFKRIKEKKNSMNKYYWAEEVLTWANILQHRSKLL